MNYALYTHGTNSEAIAIFIVAHQRLVQTETLGKKKKKSFHLNQLRQFDKDEMILRLHLNWPRAFVSERPSE